jgi:hypothetical protein
LVDLTTHIAFWKRREASKPPEPERIIPLPNLSGTNIETPPIASSEALTRARDTLKILRLEKQILGSAVTTIYESQSKGLISEAERDQMLEKYKIDLKRLEKGIEENQQIVELHDLQVERDELVKNFESKLAAIDSRLKGLKSGAPMEGGQIDGSRDHGGQGNGTVDPPALESQVNPDRQTTSDSEKRIEQIREEILRAMDRLEQIETEG